MFNIITLQSIVTIISISKLTSERFENIVKEAEACGTTFTFMDPSVENE